MTTRNQPSGSGRLARGGQPARPAQIARPPIAHRGKPAGVVYLFSCTPAGGTLRRSSTTLSTFCTPSPPSLLSPQLPFTWSRCRLSLVETSGETAPHAPIRSSSATSCRHDSAPSSLALRCPTGMWQRQQRVFSAVRTETRETAALARGKKQQQQKRIRGPSRNL